MVKRFTGLTILMVIGGWAVISATGTHPELRAADAAAGNSLSLSGRYRVPAASGGKRYETHARELRWEPAKTALIIVDMWDQHWCQGASRRVAEVAPQMNRFAAAARDKGVLIVHAPSSCMEPYQDLPGRRLAQSAPSATNLPKDIGEWCRHIPAEDKGTYPVDQSDGGCDCTPKCPGGSPWRREVATIEIRSEDAISDSGVEIWNLFESRGIENVMIMGVHTNMCVLGRPFGLRQMSKNGKNVVLVRDLTDTMYNSRAWPFVSHFHGTDLIVEHIEKFVCPTITSDQLLGGSPFRFADDIRSHVVFAISEAEYKTAQTLPRFAAEELEGRLGLETTILSGDANDPDVIPGLAQALDHADLLFVSMRRRAMPEKDLEAVRNYLQSGRPLVGIRTASHAFDAKGKGAAGRSEWPKFDPEVLGGNYHGHHPEGPKTTVTIAPDAKSHPILTGLDSPFTSNGSLYQVNPLASSTTPLLIGSIPAAPQEPIAWVNTAGKSRVFYTSLGHPDDFDNPQFVRLLANAVLWALEKPVPPATAGPKSRDVGANQHIPAHEWRERTTLGVHTNRCTGMAFSPDSRTLATVGGAEQGEVKLWDVATGEELASLPGHAHRVMAVAFSPDGRTLATSDGVWNGSGEVKLWDVASRKERTSFPTKGGALSVAFSPDSRMLAVGSGYFTEGKYFGTVTYWNLPTGQDLGNPLQGDIGEVTSLAFTPDGTRLVTTGSYFDVQTSKNISEVKLWEAMTGKERSSMYTTHSEVTDAALLRYWSVAFSRDGRMLAAAGQNGGEGMARVWEVAKGSWANLLGHRGPVWSVAFTPDSQTLATGDGSDGCIRLWDVPTGRQRTTLPAFHGAIFSLAFSPDGKNLVAGGTAGGVGTVKWWSLRNDE